MKTAPQEKRTKYIILLGDGMGDYPISELNNQTVLEYARTPNMDFIAQHGLLGLVQTIPESFPPGSDVANLSIFGYDPRQYYTGRAPLEAANIGVNLTSSDVAFRCNLVTITKGKMEDFSAGHISTEEARPLIDDLNARLGSAEFQFFTGTSYRHLLVWKNGHEQIHCTPPHDISDQNVDNYLPQGEMADQLLKLMNLSQEILKNHPVNKRRAGEGKKVANSTWFWGQGRAPKMPSFRRKYGESGAIISAVDLLKGIGRCLGLEIIKVPGVTGYLDTNYAGKAEYALSVLQEKDMVYVHVEAPDEASHNGDINAKIKAIEDFDRLIVGAILDRITQFISFRIMILPDHFTPISIRTHTSDPVPFAIFPANGKRRTDKINKPKKRFSEKDARGETVILEGHQLMEFFLRRRK